MRPGSFGAWQLALRPPSLLVAVSPVLVAAALVFARTGALDVGMVLLALAAAVVMQVITNLQNDVGYTVRGAERRGNRVGLPRATATGLLTVRQVRAAVLAAVVAAMLLGLPLVLARGLPVLVMGVASIVAALAYMGGPRPIAYTPLGEATVFVFFGPVAVAGTEFVLTGQVTATSVLAGVAMGGIALAALVVNNYRDIAHDREVGRRTFPVVFGAGAARALYALGLLAPFALLAVLAWFARSPWMLAPVVLLPSAMRLRRDFEACAPGLPFNVILFRTFRLEMVFAALLAAGAVLGRLLD